MPSVSRGSLESKPERWPSTRVALLALTAAGLNCALLLLACALHWETPDATATAAEGTGAQPVLEMPALAHNVSADVPAVAYDNNDNHNAYNVYNSNNSNNNKKNNNNNVSADVSCWRWLWWPLMVYLFWAMAHVCDVYFMQAIDVITERFQIPDDVAAATLMALGCNGPEMALNAIAILNPSVVGVGAVIGGEVFNILVIIGTALLATPDMYMPLKLGYFTFFRDVLFYMLSVALLFWTLQDGSVSRTNSLVLLAGGVLYTTTVAMSSRLRHWFAKRAPRLWPLLRGKSGQLSSRSSLTALPDPRQDPDNLDFLPCESARQVDKLVPVPDPELLAQWQAGSTCRVPSDGSVLEVRTDVANRLMDRTHHYDERFVCLGETAVMVSTALDPQRAHRNMGRCTSGIVYDQDKLVHHHHWHHGGLVNLPHLLGRAGGQPCSKPDAASSGQFGSKPDAASSGQLYVPLLPRSFSQEMPAGVMSHCFEDVPWELIPLDDVLFCEFLRDPPHLSILVRQHDSALGNLVTMKLRCKDEAVINAWAEALKERIIENRRRLAVRSCSLPWTSRANFLMEWVDWIQFPLKSFLALTIPNMDKPELQKWCALSFLVSMAWLAVLGYLVVAVCNGIHRDFGISTTVLGFTFAAAGTSFPNVLSGMAVARQGRTTMAVANALGANVQNVFIALAVPWTIHSCFISGGPFPLVIDDLVPAILGCYMAVLPVVLVFLCCSSFPRWSGFLFLLIYAAYLGFVIAQEAWS